MSPIRRRNTILDPENPKDNSQRLDTTSEFDSNFAPPRTCWQLDADRIIKKLMNNQTFKSSTDLNLESVPLCDDLTRYGVSEENGRTLVSLEIRRLVDIVNSGKPMQLEGNADWYGKADEEGYLMLDKLARQMSLALDICLHDFSLIMIEHDPSNAVPKVFLNARDGILKVFDPTISDDPVNTWNRMRLDVANDQALHCLVNYLTGIFAQLLLRVMEGEYWDDNCIITLARVATKIKVVGLDLAHAAETSLCGKKEWVARLKRMRAEEPDPPALNGQRNLSAIETQNVSMARQVVVREQKYLGVMSTFNRGLLILLAKVTGAILADHCSSLPPDVFESCSLVYDTGFRGHRALICQERDGSIGASGSRDEVHCASFAFSMCLEVFEKLENQAAPETHTAVDSATMIRWKWTKTRGGKLDAKVEDTDVHPKSDEKRLTSMADVITAIIPYLMTCGPFSSQLDSMVATIIAFSNSGEPVQMCADTGFLSSFVIRTTAYDRFRMKTSFGNKNTTSVLDSDIAKTQLLDQDYTDPHEELRARMEETNQKIAEGLAMMSKWTIDKESIIIPTRWYCWGTLALCAILVLGGLAIGLTVQQRINGVDPFNLSIFCWTLAAFIVLFVKALRVEDWPWRDFFRGKVVCRSASEVVAVSRIEAQILLCILLRLESTIILTKCGPFGGIFKQKGDQGFSIDLPLTTEFMMKAGYFFIQVQGSKGPALVAVNAAQGREYNSVDPLRFAAREYGRKCLNLQDPSRWGSGEREKDLYLLVDDEVHWCRVEGIFAKDAYFS